MQTKPMLIVRRTLVTGVIAAVMIAGGIYGKRFTSPSRAEPAAPSPAIGVVVQTLVEQKIRVWSEFSGRLHAVDSAEIRPEVGGRITAGLFWGGQAAEGGGGPFRHRP